MWPPVKMSLTPLSYMLYVHSKYISQWQDLDLNGKFDPDWLYISVWTVI